MPGTNLPPLKMVIQAQDKTNAAFAKVTRNTEQISRRMQRLERQASSVGNALRTALGAVTAAVGVREIASLADEYTNLQNKLRVTTSSSEELADVTDKLFNIAQQTRSEFSATTTVYSRLALQAKEVGLTQDEMLKITERLNQAIVVGGSTAAEASNAMIQLSQGMASGTLRGDELRSVLEQLPVVAQLIAREMGVTIGELRQLGADGLITSDIVANALLKADDVAEQYAKTISTLGQAFTVLRNQAVRYTGEVGKSTGAVKIAVSAIGALTVNFGHLANAVGAAGVGLATYFGASVLASVKAGLSAISVAAITTSSAMVSLKAAFVFLTGPLGIALAAAGGAMAYFALQTREAAKHAKVIDQITNNLVTKFQGQIKVGDISLEDTVGKLKEKRDEVKAELDKVDKLVADFQGRINVANSSAGFDYLEGGENARELTKRLEELQVRQGELRLTFEATSNAFEQFNRKLEEQQELAKKAEKAQKETTGAFDKFIDKVKLETEVLTVSEAEALRLKKTKEGLAAITKQYGEVSDENRALLKGYVDQLVATTVEQERLEEVEKKRVKSLKEIQRLIKTASEVHQQGPGHIQGLERQLEIQRLIANGEHVAAKSIQQINSLKARGVRLSEDQIARIYELNAQLAANEQRYGALEKAAREAANPTPWEQFQQSLTETEHAIQEAGVNAFKSMEDSLVELAREGSASFRDFAEGVLEDLARIAFRARVIGPILSAFGGIPGFSGGGEVKGFASGGQVKGYASGGRVSGPGTGTSDSIPALLSDGEHVINAKAANRYRPLLDAINTGKSVIGSVMNVTINNNTPAEVTVHESTSSSGIRELEIFVDQTVAKSMMTGSGARALKALGAR